MENNIDDLVSGVEIYVEKKIGDAPFDKTLNGIIKGINSENHYSVLINGRVYDNIESDETCVINESVKILVPQNNYNKMFILKNNNGGKSSDVTSVNGKVGDVILNANDVEALPNTTVIPNKTSQLTNDSNYVSDVNYVHTDNNFTTTEKNKLSNIESNAQVNTVTGVKGNSETNYRVGNINITQDNIGLGNVENVSTNNQTPTWTISSTLSNLTSGEKLSVAFGKIAKAISSLISHIGNVANPHGVTKSQVGLENVDNTSDADKPISTVAQTKFDEIDEDMKYQQNVTTNNMLKVTLPTTTLNGITCTNNGDGTYTLNGTATASFNVVVGSMSFTEGNYYRLVGFPIQGVQDSFGLYVSGLFKFDKGDGITFVSQSSGSYTVRIQVSTGYSCENIIIKPMLTTNLDATYDDFVRYTGNQGKLNADVAGIVNSLGSAAYRNWTNTISSGGDGIPLGGAVYNALSGKEDSFTKNTAFNKNFGTTSDTVCQGNDSRLSDSRNAKDVYEWAKESTKPTYTKSEVGLSNVPNVATNDQTPTYTEATTRSNLTSGEKLSVAFGKIMKWFSDLKSVAFSGSYNDLSDTPTIPTVGNGTITFTQNGTSKGTITTNQSGNATIALTDNNTTYGVATSSTLGLVKSGTDITIDTNGNVSVNDDSHNHVISNIDGLQSSLDSKYSPSNPQTSVSGSSGSCTGNSATATTATKLSNTSAIGSSSQPVYFNSSGVPVVVDNCTPKSHASSDTTYGVASSSNYGHAMASSATPLVAGTASVGTDNGKFAREGHIHPQQESVRLLNNLYTTRPTDANVTPTGSGGVSTFQATSSMTSNKPPIGDAHVIHMFWDNTSGWDSQLAVSNSSSRNGVQYRCMNNGTWGNWDTLLSLGNNVTSTISSGNTSLPTSDAVYNYVATATNYQEGTWTPTLMPSSASQSTVATIVAQGVYRKIGKMVYIKGYLETSSAYSCANISGIPYSIGMTDVTSLPSQVTSSLTISRANTNEINKCSLSQYWIKNLGYSSSVTSTSWLIDGWYTATS